MLGHPVAQNHFVEGCENFFLGFADFLDCVCAMPYLQNSKTTSIFQSWNEDYLCLKVSLKGLKSYSKHRSIRGHQQSFLIRFVYFMVFENILGSDLLHTIRKVKFLSKKSILTKPQHFHEFFTQIFFDNFSREIKVVNS